MMVERRQGIYKLYGCRSWVPCLRHKVSETFFTCRQIFPATFSAPEQPGTPPLTKEKPYAIIFIYNAPQKHLLYISQQYQAQTSCFFKKLKNHIFISSIAYI